jgi:hypothetical protein
LCINLKNTKHGSLNSQFGEVLMNAVYWEVAELTEMPPAFDRQAKTGPMNRAEHIEWLEQAMDRYLTNAREWQDQINTELDENGDADVSSALTK